MFRHQHHQEFLNHKINQRISPQQNLTEIRKVLFFKWKCRTHNGKTLWTEPRGGCYYYNSNGNKTYVDRSECNC